MQHTQGLKRRTGRLGLTGAIVLLAGCTQYLNIEDVEANISNTFQERTGLNIAAVNCPDKQPVKKGEVFECEGRLQDNQVFTLAVTQVQTPDAQNGISWDAKASLETLKGVVDNERLATQITEGIKSQTNIEVVTDCGRLFRIARKGESFTCITTDQQKQTEVMIKVEDDDGSVSWEL